MDTPRERHGLLALVLMFWIVINGFIAVGILSKPEAFHDQFPTIPPAVFLAVAALAILNVVFLVALFNWQRWGFFGFAITNAVLIVLDLAIGEYAAAALPLIGVAILYGALHLGSPNGWSQLRSIIST